MECDAENQSVSWKQHESLYINHNLLDIRNSTDRREIIDRFRYINELNSYVMTMFPIKPPCTVRDIPSPLKLFSKFYQIICLLIPASE